MANKTRWFKYGQPVSDQRVEAWIRTTYQTGPNEAAREDDIEHGFMTFDGLDLLETDDEIQEHIHDDGSLLLSGLSADAEDRLMAQFEHESDLMRLIRGGCSPSEAVDYLIVEERGWTQSAWAEVRGIGQQSVSENVAKARDKLNDRA
jgi:hypothetical protein